MNYLAVIFHELREIYRGFRYPGYEPLHHPVVQNLIDEYLQAAMDRRFPCASEWKRVPPGKQVVSIDYALKIDDEWKIIYHPIRGGRVVTRELAWFTENFVRHDL